MASTETSDLGPRSSLALRPECSVKYRSATQSSSQSLLLIFMPAASCGDLQPSERLNPLCSEDWVPRESFCDTPARNRDPEPGADTWREGIGEGRSHEPIADTGCEPYLPPAQTSLVLDRVRIEHRSRLRLLQRSIYLGCHDTVDFHYDT